MRTDLIQHSGYERELMSQQTEQEPKAITLMDHSDALFSAIATSFRQPSIRHYKTLSLLPATQLNTNFAAKQGHKVATI